MAATSKKKKVVSAIAAVATSAALLLGGTLAWQSANQVALNEASDVINPGGRLHDDFDGTNKDVYVENFTPEDTGEPIYARIRLEEYFEIITNYDTAAEKVHTLVGTRTATATDAGSTDNTGESIVNIGSEKDAYYVRGYRPFTFDNVTTVDGVTTVNAAVDADDTAWWKWTLGGETVYMPTYNKNKDSLMVDVNGKFDGAVGTITDKDGTDPDAQYTADRQADFPYVEYTVDEVKTANELYDGDTNNIDEVKTQAELLDMINNGTELYAANIEIVEDVEHKAKATQNAKVISLADYNALTDDEKDAQGYWVYDDGWFYWSKAIEPGTATGLLLDGIELNQVMDDTWYYAINVVAQFVTADDVGKSDGTGFYDEEKGTVPTDAAEEFLKEIGVTSVSDGPAEDDDEPQTYDLILTADGANTVSATTKDSFNIGFDESGLAEGDTADTTGIVVYQEDASGYSLRSTPVALGDTQYSYADGVLSLTDSALTGTLRVTDLNGVLYGFILLPTGGSQPGEDDFPAQSGTISNPDGTVSLQGGGNNLSVNSATNTITVKPAEGMGTPYLNIVTDPEIEAYANGVSLKLEVYDENSGAYTDYTGSDLFANTSMELDVELTETAAGKYKLTVTREQSDEYDAFNGSVEFTVDIWDGTGAGGEEEEQFTVVLGSNYVDSYSTKATTAGYNTNTAALYEYGEPYGGTGVVTWRLEADLGDIDDTTIDSDGNISIGVELENGVNDYEIFKVIASIDGEDVASRNMLVLAYRSSNIPVHGLRFLDADGAEVPADQLVTGVTYTVESYMRLFVDGSDAMANGDPLTDYFPYYPVDQMQGIKVSIADPLGDADPSVAAFSDGQFTAYVADTYLIRSEGGNYDLEYLLYQEVTASGTTGGEEEVVDTFTIEGTEMTDTDRFDYYLAEDTFIYTVGQEHTLHVDGLTNHLGGSPDTGKFSIYKNSNYNVLEVFINKLTEEGPGINAEYLPTSAVWNDETSQYDITFTIPQEWVDAGIDAMMMRLVSYSEDSGEWSAGPAGPYLVIMLEEAAGSGSDTPDPSEGVQAEEASPEIATDWDGNGSLTLYRGKTYTLNGFDYGGVGTWPASFTTMDLSSDDGSHTSTLSGGDGTYYLTVAADEPCNTLYLTGSGMSDGPIDSYKITVTVEDMATIEDGDITGVYADESSISDDGKVYLGYNYDDNFYVNFYFTSDDESITNADVSWRLKGYTADGEAVIDSGIYFYEGSMDGRTVTVYHTCPDADNCDCQAEYYEVYAEDVVSGDIIYRGSISSSPTFTVGDMTATAVIDYNLSSGARVESGVYAGHIIQVTSSDLSDIWSVNGIGENTYSTGLAQDNTYGYAEFTIPADTAAGAEITVTQTGTDNTEYTITLVVCEPLAVPDITISYTGDFEDIVDNYITLAPGENAQFVFEDANGVLTSNAEVEWAITAMNGENKLSTVTGMTISEDSEDSCLATVYHSCEAGSCICDDGASVITHYMVSLTASDGSSAAECDTYLKHSAGEAEYTAPTFGVGDETNAGVDPVTGLVSGDSADVYPGANLLITSSDSTEAWSAVYGDDETVIVGEVSSDISAGYGYFRFTVPEDIVGQTITVTQTGADGNDYSITLNVVKLPPELITTDGSVSFENYPDLTGLLVGNNPGAVTVTWTDENGQVQTLTSSYDADGTATRRVAVTMRGTGDDPCAYQTSEAMNMADLCLQEPCYLVEFSFCVQEKNAEGKWETIYFSDDSYFFWSSNVHTYMGLKTYNGTDYMLFTFDEYICVAPLAEVGSTYLYTSGYTTADDMADWNWNTIAGMDFDDYTNLCMHYSLPNVTLAAVDSSDDIIARSDENGKLTVSGPEDGSYELSLMLSDGYYTSNFKYTVIDGAGNTKLSKSGNDVALSYGNGGETTIQLQTVEKTEFTVQYVLTPPLFTLTGDNGTAFTDVEHHGENTPPIEVYPGTFTVSSTVSTNVASELSIEWENAGLVNNGFVLNDDGTYTLTISEQTPVGATATIKQTVGGAEYYITLAVSRLMPAPIINYAGDPANIDDEGYITLAPSESAQFVFEDANGVLTSNADVDWFLEAIDEDGSVDETANYSIACAEGSGDTATVTHSCEEGYCTCDGYAYRVGITYEENGETKTLYGSTAIYHEGGLYKELTLVSNADRDDYANFPRLRLNTPVELLDENGNGLAVFGNPNGSYATCGLKYYDVDDLGLLPINDADSSMFTYDESAHTLTITDESLIGKLCVATGRDEDNNLITRYFWLVGEDGTLPYSLSLSATANKYPVGGSLSVTYTASAVDANGEEVSLKYVPTVYWKVTTSSGFVTEDNFVSIFPTGYNQLTLDTTGYTDSYTIEAYLGGAAAEPLTLTPEPDGTGEPSFSVAYVDGGVIGSGYAPNSTVTVTPGTEVQLYSTRSSTTWSVTGATEAKAGYNASTGTAGSYYHVTVPALADAGSDITVTQTVDGEEYSIVLRLEGAPVFVDEEGNELASVVNVTPGQVITFRTANALTNSDYSITPDNGALTAEQIDSTFFRWIVTIPSDAETGDSYIFNCIAQPNGSNSRYDVLVTFIVV